MKVVEWIEKEMGDYELVEQLKNSKDKSEIKKTKQSKPKQDSDPAFTSACSFFLNYDKKSKQDKSKTKEETDKEEEEEKSEADDKDKKDDTAN